MIEIRICATSDIHGHLPEIPDCDVLLLAGDLGPYPFDKNVKGWWRNEFGPWLADLTMRGIVVLGIAGNHDFILRDEPEFIHGLGLPWIYLQDSGIQYKGISFYGTPWQPWYAGWAFQGPEWDESETFLDKKFEKIPEHVDVLISHAPPAGILDKVGNRYCGSLSLNRHIQRVMPRLAVFGHIHVGFGVETIGECTMANVSLCGTIKGASVPMNQPVLFDL